MPYILKNNFIDIEEVNSFDNCALQWEGVNSLDIGKFLFDYIKQRIYALFRPFLHRKTNYWAEYKFRLMTLRLFSYKCFWNVMNQTFLTAPNRNADWALLFYLEITLGKLQLRPGAIKYSLWIIFLTENTAGTPSVVSIWL